MAAPRTLEPKLERALVLIEDALREGYPPQGTSSGLGAVGRAGHLLAEEGVCTNHQQIFQYVSMMKGRIGREPDWTLYRPARYQQPSAKYNLLPAPDPRPYQFAGEMKRRLIIPDRHNDPRHPHRLAATTWIARYGSEHRHEEVIDLGDAVTMDSCSKYDKNDTLKGRFKPKIRDDLDNHLAMLQAFERGRDADWKPRKNRVRGNHEKRLFDFENMHPEDEGTHTHRYCQELMQFGWRERPYGEIYYSDGVGYCHAPLAGGREVGGKTGPLRSANDLCRSLVHGHTHKFHFYDAPKNDPVDKISVIAAGCALPEGEVEHYATHGGATGWRYGILDLWSCEGDIVDFRWVSMASLRSRYSDDGADVAA